MNIVTLKALLLVLYILLRNIHAAGITEKAVEAYLRCEYSKPFGGVADMSVIGALGLDSGYALRAGVSYGALAGGADIRAFAGAGGAPFPSLPLKFSASYIYNGLPGYEAHSHTFLPLASYNLRMAGVSAGPSLRFTSFFGEPAIFESVLTFSAYANFICSEALRIGVECGNFSEFGARNMGAYSLKLISGASVGGGWQIINELELMQSGGDGLSTVFYGIAWRGGARFSW